MINSTKKRKVGRPKKRGPKKNYRRKKIVKIYKERPVTDFKIISVLNGKQTEYIGQYQTYQQAKQKLNELEKLNNTIIFPRKFINTNIITNSKEEYLILEKNRYGDKHNNLLRNEFGRFVEHKIINNTQWIIREKTPKLTEETFWVYKYDPKIDRKTFTWIYDNLIINLIENSFDIIRILVYKNKLILKYDNNTINMVICKNKNDCIRMYNLISTTTKKQKIKQVVCVGDYSNYSDYRKELEEDLLELTGWDKKKLQRHTT
jgi:hypothetical protein